MISFMTLDHGTSTERCRTALRPGRSVQKLSSTGVFVEGFSTHNTDSIRFYIYIYVLYILVVYIVYIVLCIEITHGF